MSFEFLPNFKTDTQIFRPIKWSFILTVFYIKKISYFLNVPIFSEVNSAFTLTELEI